MQGYSYKPSKNCRIARYALIGLSVGLEFATVVAYQAPVAQLDRVLGFEECDGRFDSGNFRSEIRSLEDGRGFCRILRDQIAANVGVFLSAPVAQLDRAPRFERGGRRFESVRAHHFSKVLCVR